MNRVEITGIAKGYQFLLLGYKGRLLSKIVHEAREVGWCKGMPFPIAVERVSSPAEVKARAAECFDEVLCVMWWPPIERK